MLHSLSCLSAHGCILSIFGAHTRQLITLLTSPHAPRLPHPATVLPRWREGVEGHLPPCRHRRTVQCEVSTSTFSSTSNPSQPSSVPTTLPCSSKPTLISPMPLQALKTGYQFPPKSFSRNCRISIFVLPSMKLSSSAHHPI